MTKADKIKAAFELFDTEHPDVWRLFEEFSRGLIVAGYKSYSAYGVMHRVRWEIAFKTKSDPYKINNNFVPYYARKFINTYTRHRSFFETRELTTAHRAAA